jgi:hypothetical protein
MGMKLELHIQNLKETIWKVCKIQMRITLENSTLKER